MSKSFHKQVLQKFLTNEVSWQLCVNCLAVYVITSQRALAASAVTLPGTDSAVIYLVFVTQHHNYSKYFTIRFCILLHENEFSNCNYQPRCHSYCTAAERMACQGKVLTSSIAAFHFFDNRVAVLWLPRTLQPCLCTRLQCWYRFARKAQGFVILIAKALLRTMRDGQVLNLFAPAVVGYGSLTYIIALIIQLSNLAVMNKVLHFWLTYLQDDQEGYIDHRAGSRLRVACYQCHRSFPNWLLSCACCRKQGSGMKRWAPRVGGWLSHCRIPNTLASYVGKLQWKCR